MNPERIDLNLLVVFSTIYSEGGITPAGKKLHLSQSAVSHALTRLRDCFDDPLFVRSGQTMQPTPKARNLQQKIAPLLSGLRASLNDFSSFDPARAERMFAVGMREQLESILLPRIVAEVLQQAPGISLSSVRFQRRSLEEDLSSGSVDLAIDVLQPVSGSLRHRKLSDDRLVVIARKNHPRLGQKRNITLDDYLALDHIQISGRRAGRGVEDVELHRLGKERNIRLRSQNIHAAIAAASRSDLVLTAGYAYAREAERDAKLVVLPFPCEMPPLSLYLYWHQNVDNDPANCWLRALICEVLASGIEAFDD
ncbi:LysR family transcriptional regulator [Spongiibacter sp. KMU-166]|uniref:LysR family transcriptional regulator n=1 Tax=Spongiibacter thalassae TaxID=2721624 RepID=A0ABX1GJE7_9GAMM|nr:LysR family transcriptional regulator [Spongiibacter thalassae]